MRRSPALAARLALSLVAACSGSPPATDGGVDSGRFDSGVDGGPLGVDGSLPRDGGGICAAGMHECPDGCEPDHANDPDHGCRLGCGIDACEPPAGGTAMCDASGACVGECPEGATLDGDVCCGGTITCSDGIETMLACPSPTEEPNDTNITPQRLGTYNDEDGQSEAVQGLSLPTGDVDFYAFDVVDGCCDVVGAHTIVRVTVTTPITASVELATWFSCASGGAAHACTGGTSDATFGFGCSAVAVGATGTATATLELDLDCTGTIDESGTALVRVRPTAAATMCAQYDLAFDVRT